MSMTILVVKPEPAFFSKLTTMLSPYIATLSLHVVNNRTEALEALQTSLFQQIVTPLKIPGVNDGYRFLSQIVNKVIEAKNIVALVDQKTNRVQAGIASMGLQHIYAVDDCEGIVQVILQNAGLASPAVKEPNASTNLPETTAETGQIRKALNQVMGPVGAFIYQNALILWKNQDDSAELIRIIAAEIGEKDQIGQFYAQLR